MFQLLVVDDDKNVRRFLSAVLSHAGYKTFLAVSAKEALPIMEKNKIDPRLQHCVVCFSHVYCQDLPKRRVRDYDNLELKQFLDVAASFILTDDSGLLCDAYNTTELGETDCTRISIMDSAHFPEWLAERQVALQSITDL